MRKHTICLRQQRKGQGKTSNGLLYIIALSYLAEGFSVVSFSLISKQQIEFRRQTLHQTSHRTCE